MFSCLHEDTDNTDERIVTILLTLGEPSSKLLPISLHGQIRWPPFSPTHSWLITRS